MVQESKITWRQVFTDAEDDSGVMPVCNARGEGDMHSMIVNAHGKTVRDCPMRLPGLPCA